MSDWIRTLESRGSEQAVLVTVASVRGSVPREAGAKMVVTAEAIGGTIGGGHLELKAIEIAHHMLASGLPGEFKRFPLGASLGQCCGGLVNLLFESVAPEVNWPSAVAALLRDGEDCVLASRTQGDGVAAKLVITDRGGHGSLGDASLDAEALVAGRSLLVANGDPVHVKVGAAGQETILFLDPIRAPDFHIALFGAGHVGRALVNVLSGLSCRITWVDSRESEFPSTVPNSVTIVLTDTPEAEVAEAPAGCYFLVMTHSHDLDQQLSEHILRRTDFAYFGLIGSESKRRRFEKRMESRGIAPNRFASMTCPIGVAGISGKEPAAIAVAVAAELLQVRDRLSVQTREPAKALRA